MTQRLSTTMPRLSPHRAPPQVDRRRRYTPWVLAGWLALAPLGGGACGDDDGGDNENSSQIITRNEALRACLAADACGVMRFLYASLCVEANWDQQYHTGTVPIWNRIYQCVLQNLGDCEAIGACFGGGAAPQACSSTGDGYCDGNVRYYCDTFDQKLYAQDCSIANQVCVMAQMSPTVQAPVCAQGPCDTGSNPTECRGNLLYNCDQGAYVIRDCSALGLVCGDAAMGSNQTCVGEGAACDSNTYEATCEGSVITRCVQNRLNELDCSTLPGDLTCESGRDECVPNGTQCEPGQESCQSGTVRICVDGSLEQIDCAELGLPSCEVVSGGAHCRP